MAAGGLVHLLLQALHGRARLVAHQVEAVGIDLVVAGPEHRRVDHQLGHHRVLGGRVEAAGRGLDAAFRIQAVVVARHHAVEDRFFFLAGDEGVVVDHVRADAQAGIVQVHHHLAELDDAARAILRVAGVAALDRVEVLRVVAPVEAVGMRGLADQGLLAFAVRRAGWLRQRAADFRDAADVVHRQQVHVGQAGLRQRAQVLHAVRVRLGEGGVLAALGLRHGLVDQREVAHVQLVDDHVGRGLHRGRRTGVVPAARLEVRRIEVGDVAALRIGVQADRVRIGDQVAHQAGAGHDDVDRVFVIGARQVARQAGRPGAGLLVELHRVHGARPGRRAVVGADRHLARGRRPQLETGLVRGWRGAEVGDGFGGGVQVVERAGRLDAGGGDHHAARVFLHQHQLFAVEKGQARQVAVRHAQGRAGGDPLEALACGLRDGGGRDVELDRTGGAGHLAADLGLDRCGRGVVQAIGAVSGGAGPAHQALVEPDGARVELFAIGLQDFLEAGAIAGLEGNGSMGARGQRSRHEGDVEFAHVGWTAPPSTRSSGRKNTAMIGS